MVYDITSYGVAKDGTDQTANLQTAFSTILTAMAGGGGNLFPVRQLRRLGEYPQHHRRGG
jgi:hypothetical protein